MDMTIGDWIKCSCPDKMYCIQNYNNVCGWILIYNPTNKEWSLYPTVLPSQKYILIGLDYKFSSTIVPDQTFALGIAKKGNRMIYVQVWQMAFNSDK